ncbi:hypothetical protein IJG72_00180 [bacterium]|nr:hypothetical protein [bacterium]
MKNSTNKSNSAYRVFETLKFLIKRPASVPEIIEYLKSLDKLKPYENKVFYSNSLIYKYLTTLKCAGIKIVRNKCKYEVKELPFKLKLSYDDICALAYFYNLQQSVPEQKLSEDLQDFFYQLQMRYPKEFSNIKEPSIELENKTVTAKPSKAQREKIKFYEKLCNDSFRIKLKYLNLESQEVTTNCDLIEVRFINGRINLMCYSILSNEFIEINDKQILEIEQLHQCCTNKYFASTTVFELSNRLAKNYVLRNGEHIIDSALTNNLVVINQQEPKEILYRRLLRYGRNCKIISSQRDKDAIKRLITNTLKNYGIED